MKRLLASIFVLGLITSPFALPALGQATSPDRAIDRELLVVSLSPEGVVKSTRILDSLTLFGNGPVTVTDLGSGASLRNLYGFESPAISGRKLTWNVNVKGSKEILTSANVNKGRAPVSLQPRYFLNGKQMSPQDMVGKSGRVTIEYRMINQTSKTETLEFIDRTGGLTKGEARTYVPLVGQVEFQLPADNWGRLSAPGGQVTTDEKNIHRVTYTAVLAPIIGVVDQTIRLEGTVKNFELSPARAVFIPLVPAGVTERASATTEGTRRLLTGAGAVDTNLLKIRDGTLQLTDGLTQLYEGILQARAGVGDVGTSNTITDGLSQVLGGLEQLGDTTEGLPAAKAGVDSLIAGVQQVLAGLGSSSQPATVLGGLQGIDNGLAALRGSAGPPPTGLTAIKGGLDATGTGVSSLAALIGTAPAPAATLPPSATTTISNDVQYMKAALLGSGACPASPSLCDVADGIQAKLDATRTCMTTGGVPGACAGAEPNGIAEGLAALSAGTQQAIGAIGTPTSDLPGGSPTLRKGVNLVAGGVNQIKAGLSSGDANNPKILEGLQAVADGLSAAIAGIGTVGTSNTLIDGTNQLLEGSQELADGLDQIADGTAQAKDGAGQLASGGTSLSAQASSPLKTSLAERVDEAAISLATLKAMRNRAQTDAFLFGAPEGAEASTTYVYQVAGVTRDQNIIEWRFVAAAGLIVGLVLFGSVTLGRKGGRP